MTVFDYMSIGRTAMNAFRLAMDISGYNVANASTPGFSRRRIEFGTLPAVAVQNGLIGTGVDVTSVTRMRDQFLDFSTRREMGRLGADKSRQQILSGLEPTLGSADSAALNTALSNFFDSFENVSQQPDSMAARAQAVGKAQELAATFRRIDSALVEARRNADTRVGDTVGRVNQILDQLRQMNVDVTAQEAGGAQASDLRDQRDRLLDELSSLVDVRTVEQGNGQISVFMEGSGDTLLAGVSVNSLAMTQDSEGFKHVIVNRGGEKADITATLRTGQLGGLLKSRDDDIAGYRASLDALASSVITAVNAKHEAGYGLTGATGVALFQPDPPGTHAASAIQVNAQVAADPRLLAAADQPGEPGNNTNALALAGLRNVAQAALGGRSLGDYAADLNAAVGSDVKTSEAGLQAGQTIVDSLDGQRQQVSGVSLDEEAANLVRWQQSFQASARFLQTVNTVIDSAMQLLLPTA